METLPAEETYINQRDPVAVKAVVTDRADRRFWIMAIRHPHSPKIAGVHQVGGALPQLVEQPRVAQEKIVGGIDEHLNR